MCHGFWFLCSILLYLIDIMLYSLFFFSINVYCSSAHLRSGYSSGKADLRHTAHLESIHSATLSYSFAEPLNLYQFGAQPFFRSLQICSVGFKSRLWLGHSRSFPELSWNHCFVIAAVCLGSSSCSKMNHSPSPRSRELWSRLSSSIFLYIAAVIFLRPWLVSKLPLPKNFPTSWRCHHHALL